MTPEQFDLFMRRLIAFGVAKASGLEISFCGSAVFIGALVYWGGIGIQMLRLHQRFSINLG